MRKALAIFALAGIAGAALAQRTGIAGTRLSNDYIPPANSGTGVGFGALAQMVLALVIVAFLLKWVLPKLAGKIGKKLVTTTTGGIQVEETAQFAGGNLFIISARGKTMLISVTGQTVSTLADLTQPEPKKVDPFELALAEAQLRPTPTPAELEARAALDRLSHLTGSHADR